MKHVRDVMHPGIIACTPDTTLGEAAALLNQHRIHALVVAQDTGTRELLGILSDLDLLTGEWLSTDRASLETMRHITAGEMMSKPALTISAEAPVADAIAMMKTNQVHRLIVADRDKPVGIVSVGDIVLSLARQSTTRQTVADVMSRGIVVCLQATKIHQAARAMSERRSRSMIVIDPYGEPRGIITGWDLLNALDAEGETAEDRTVTEIMHQPLTIRPGASLREAADMMISQHVHRLLVVDPSQPETFPLGLISTFDIVAEMAEPESVWQD